MTSQEAGFTRDSRKRSGMTTTKELYWFARGYHDGRLYGNEESAADLYDDESKQLYKRGYDCGVADYCAIFHENEVNA